MTTEEWRRLPAWVKIGLIEGGFGASQIARVHYDSSADPKRIDLVLKPVLPDEIAFSVVVDPGG